MRTSLFILVSLLTLKSSLAADLEQPRWKSFDQAKEQCARYLGITNKTLQRYADNGYPDEPSDRKLINCIFINLNSWDEDKQEPRDYAFSQFFYPSTTDCQFREHTQECIRQNVLTLDTGDRLGRAYNAFQCYLRNWAGIRPEAQYIPYTVSELVQNSYDCMHIVPHSRESLLEYCQGRVLTNPDYASLAYCFFTRSGLYNESTGFDLQKVYVDIGNPGIIGDEIKQCIVDVEDQYCREPDRILYILLNCLVKYLPAIPTISVAASNALGNPPECVIPPAPRPKTQPCYNCAC